jgi:DNA-binding IclR family transcriptional regulator
MAQASFSSQVQKSSVPAVQSLERAARILLTFTPEEPALGLAEISRRVDLSKSTVRRLLLTLEDLGFVTGDRQRGVYRLGVACLRLGQAAQASIDLRGKARPAMETLVSKIAETAYLFIRSGNEAVCIDIVEAHRDVRVLYTGVGTSFPLHVGAAPRALLSTLTESEITGLLSRPLKNYTPATLGKAPDIRADIERTRRLRYAMSIDDLVVGVAGIGCVIWDHRGDAAGAISISGLKDRYIGPELGRFTEAVMRAAAAISSELGFQPELSPSD